MGETEYVRCPVCGLVMPAKRLWVNSGFSPRCWADLTGFSDEELIWSEAVTRGQVPGILRWLGFLEE